MRSSKLVAAAAATALLALAACSTEKEDTATTSAAVDTTAAATGDTTGDTTPADPNAVVDDRAPGVTDDTVKIGVMYTDFTRVGPLLGYDQGDIEAAYNAIVDDINAKGGVNGRQIELVFAPTDPSLTDGPTTSCTNLTQDEHVFLVMGFLFGDSGLCVTDTNETLAIGGGITSEQLAQAKVGWWTLDDGEDFFQQSIQTMADAGVFGDKLTVVGTSDDKTTYETIIKPILDAAGVTPLEVAYMDPTFDVEKTYSDAQTIAEKFKSDGSDQVLILSVGGTFLQGLVRTDWRPQPVFAAMAHVGVYSSGEGNDLSVLNGLVSVGQYDSANQYQELGSPTKECVDLQTAAGIELKPLRDVPKGESQQITSSMIACKYMGLLVAALEAAGPTLNYGTFTTAMNNLGDIMLPGWPKPLHFGPGDAIDGNPELFVYDWDPALADMVVRG